ncbi:MAG: Gfo/Idh/MocA family protein [Planctomycetota bacterium]
MKNDKHRDSKDDLQGRRDFMKLGALAATAAGMGLTQCTVTREQAAGPAPAKPFAAPPMERVRIGFVGVGGMGSHHVSNLLKIEGADIHAVCDIVEEKVRRIQQWVVDAGQPEPTGYWRGDWDFVRMCENEDLDLVFTATPWRWHVPVCVAAMKNGKHAATEVPAAVTLDECWELVETSEKLKKHCVMMENCCYGRSEMLVLNMVRQGLFGEVLYAEAGYLHDLRNLKFTPAGEGLWRTDHSIRRDGNLYPTHGLGPVAQCMNINRGDRFEFLVSMSTKSRGLNLFAETKFGPDDPKTLQKYELGDINTSLIRTHNGCVITLVHDCSSPRPYSRINMVQGTNGIFSGYPDRIHIEGRSPAHQWEEPDKYFEEFEHPLWKAEGERAKGRGHGGMDFLENYRLIHCLKNGLPLDMDVYDAAAWSVVSDLTERSVANKSRPVDFPDFTRGRWKTKAPLKIVES